MKILKGAFIVIAALMILGWIWQGVKSMLYIALICGVLYFVFQYFFGEKSAEEKQ